VPWQEAAAERELNVGITLEKGDEADLISLQGVIDISVAADLKSAFLEALKSGKEVRVEFDPDCELDVTVIQLLWAAERDAKARGVGFDVAGQVPAKVAATVKDAGFEGFQNKLN
jgi:anti-anti-sigma regulatory factor